MNQTEYDMRISDWSSDVLSTEQIGQDKNVRRSIPLLGSPSVLVLTDFGCRSGHHHAAGLQQVGVIGEFERQRCVLLDQEHRDAALAVDPAQNAEQFPDDQRRSEEHTSELQSLMRISYAVFCLKKKNKHRTTNNT